jgi:hypothetical protein
VIGHDHAGPAGQQLLVDHPDAQAGDREKSPSREVGNMPTCLDPERQ